MWAPARGACLSAWVYLGRLLAAFGVALIPVAALRPGAPMLRRAGKMCSGVGLEQVILHVFQMREKRGQALVDDGRVS